MSIYEFPEDKSIVHVNLTDYDSSFFATDEHSNTLSTTHSHYGPAAKSANQRFNATLIVLLTCAFSLWDYICIIAQKCPLFAAIVAIFPTLLLREWNRVFGMLLSRKLRASINYQSVLREQKDYIPFYDMEWLFGKRYKPYYFGCTGPSVNPEMDRTPNDDDSRSPVGSKEELKMKNFK